MGYQDRDWYRDHHSRNEAATKARYHPKTFRRGPAPRQPASSSSPAPLAKTFGVRRATIIWFLIVAFATVLTSQFLRLRHGSRVESVLAAGTSPGGLHIVSTVKSTATIELRQINERGVDTGPVWIIVIPGGAVQDRLVPVGTYRAVVTLSRFGLDSKPSELAVPLQIVPIARKAISGTLRF